MVADILKPHYTRLEEYANAITHGIAVALSIVALWVMVASAVQFGDAIHITSVSVFGGSLILLYLMSTLYHSFQNPSIKYVFRILDHSSIYLLIAGSYTPFTLISMRGGLGWTLFAVIWILAVSGVIFKLFFTGQFHITSTLLYVGMGWLAILAIKPILHNVPTGGIVWLIAGGLLYTFGVVFYLWRRVPFHHAIWHLFVMAGSFSHFMAIYYYVLPTEIV